MIGNGSINTTIVKNELGLSSNLVSVLCKSSNINKYSKHKPYSANYTSGIYGPSGTDDTIIKSLNYNMVPRIIRYTEVGSDASLNPNLVWGLWSPPTSKLRLGDFRGYNHTNKTLFINKIEMYNSLNSNSTKPLVVEDLDIGSVHTRFYGMLSFNWNAEIKLQDFTYGTVSANDMYLTIIISANVGGIDLANCIYALASESLYLFCTSNENTNNKYIVSIETSIRGFKHMLDANGGRNIVFVGLAPRIAIPPNTGTIFDVCSLNMYDTAMTGLVYNNNYAKPGDGDGGGPALTKTLYGHILPKNILVNVIEDSINFDCTLNGSPSIIITGGSSGGSVDCSIGMQIEIYNSQEMRVYENYLPFTEVTTMTSGSSHIFTEVGKYADIFGIRVPKADLGGTGLHRMVMRIYVDLRSSSTSQPTVLGEDGQGLESNWLTEYVNL